METIRAKESNSYPNPEMEFLLGLENPYEIFQYCESACLSVLLTLVTAFQEPYYEYLKTNTPNYNKAGDSFKTLCEKILSLEQIQDQSEMTLYWVQIVSFSLTSFLSHSSMSGYNIPIKQETEKFNYNSRVDNESGTPIFDNLIELIVVIQSLMQALLYNSPQYKKIYDSSKDEDQHPIPINGLLYKHIPNSMLRGLLDPKDILTKAMFSKFLEGDFTIDLPPPEKRCPQLSNNQLAINILRHYELVDRYLSRFLAWEKYCNTFFKKTDHKKRQRAKGSFYNNFERKWIERQTQGGPWSFIYPVKLTGKPIADENEENFIIEDNPGNAEALTENSQDQDDQLLHQDVEDEQEYVYTQYIPTFSDTTASSKPNLEGIIRINLKNDIRTFWNINMNTNIPKNHRRFMKNILLLAIEKLASKEIQAREFVDEITRICLNENECPDFLRTKKFESGSMEFVGLGKLSKAIKFNVSKGDRVVVYQSDTGQFGIAYMTASDYHDKRKL